MRSKRRVIGIIIAVVFVFLMSAFLLSNNLIEAQGTKRQAVLPAFEVRKVIHYGRSQRNIWGMNIRLLTIILKRYVRQIIYTMERSQKICIW